MRLEASHHPTPAVRRNATLAAQGDAPEDNQHSPHREHDGRRRQHGRNMVEAGKISPKQAREDDDGAMARACRSARADRASIHA